jgi:hypothetical protein
MTRYTVTAWCDRPFYAKCEIEAETPQEALAKGRLAIHDAPAEECDDGYYWDEWTVDTEEENDVLRYLDEPARLRVAAPRLLSASEAVLANWERGDLAAAVRELADAVADAKGLAV